jgi:hypothetical protein
VVGPGDGEHGPPGPEAESFRLRCQCGPGSHILFRMSDPLADDGVRSTTPFPACGPSSGSMIAVPVVSAVGSQLGAPLILERALVGDIG